MRLMLLQSTGPETLDPTAVGISHDNSGSTANGFNAAFDFDGTYTVQAGVAQGAFVGNFGITLT